MRHAFIDKYAYRDSPVHRLNPALKVAFTLGFILTLLILSGQFHDQAWLPWLYWGCFGFLLIIIFLSGLPPLALTRKVAVILPFILAIILLNLLAGSAPAQAGHLIARSLLSILALVILVSTTRFHEILQVLALWRVPRVIRLTLSFMYRYFFLLIDEAEKMARAFRVRYQGNSNWEKLKLMSVITGILFIRSYERAERVYHAMVMRGYTGE